MTIETFLPLLRPFFGAAGLVLAFVGGVGLFSPDAWIEALGLLDVRRTSRSEFGLSFLVGLGVLFAVQFFDKESALQKLRGRRAARAAAQEKRERQRKRLERLAPDEKAVLARYVNDKKTALAFDAAHGVANGLAAQEILFRTAVDGLAYKTIYNLHPWARDILSEHPEVLTGATPPPAARRGR